MPPSSSAPDDGRLLHSLHEEQRRIGLRFRPLSIAFNAGFALLFAWLQIWPLAAIYLAGGLFYGWLSRATNRPGYRPTKLVLWIWLVVFFQSLCAVMLLGPGSGFQFYLLGTIPASFASLQRPLSHKIFQGLVIATFFFLCDMHWLASYHAPFSPDRDIGHLLRAFNGLGTCAILAWSAHTRALIIAETEDALRHIASTDTLTGLLNRRAISEIADRECARKQRSQSPVSLILCDIDHFKQVNDNWGHAAGDHVLQSIANLLQGSLREYDSLARWGGEEFLLLLPETDHAGAALVAERLRASVEACALSFEDQHIPVTLTLGVSQIQQPENWHATVSRADEALYRGKAGGRNRVELA
jgi:diguanylate cyclase (GGDEF)-like protein